MLSAVVKGTSAEMYKELEEVIENCNAPGEMSPASQTIESVTNDDVTPGSLTNLHDLPSPINRDKIR
jgi:hypothetical protein